MKIGKGKSKNWKLKIETSEFSGKVQKINKFSKNSKLKIEISEFSRKIQKINQFTKKFVNEISCQILHTCLLRTCDLLKKANESIMKRTLPVHFIMPFFPIFASLSSLFLSCLAFRDFQVFSSICSELRKPRKKKFPTWKMT